MEPHNQHQLQEAIVSFLKEHPWRHSVIDVHFGISDYFADPCYKHETARTLWKLNGDGIVKYQGGFFIPPTNDLTTMTNEDQPMASPDPPTLTREQINCQIRKLKEASPDQSINGMQGWMLSFEEIDSLVKWAADMELQACINFVYDNDLGGPNFYKDLRTARRPEPPSEKELALRLLETYGASAVKLTPDQCDIIRRALGAIPTDTQ
jgi:hypothetical protein